MNEAPFASIEKIILVTPTINSSDAFEKATLSDYSQVVFEKGLFKLDDLCVFCKKNSKLPDRPEFEILKQDNFIVKKKIIAGDVSEGICFPLSILPRNTKIEIGIDVSNVLHITFHDDYKKLFAQYLIREIKKAFSKVTLEDGISLRQANELDYYGDPQSVYHLDERKDWKKVTDEDLIKYHTSVYAFCDEKGKTFYLPAYMCSHLSYFIKGKDSYFWNLIPTFSVAFDFRNLLWVNKFENLSAQQTKTFKEFLAFSLSRTAEEFFEFLKIVNTQPKKRPIESQKKTQKNVSIGRKYKLKFINKPNKIRNKK